MTSLFISYGSADRGRAVDVASRLRGAGYGTVFLDVDPDDGIAPGKRWERELYAALRRSEATVFLASDSSVTSQWCFAELALTRSLGRPVVPARVGGAARPLLVADVQEVDLRKPAGFDHLLAALREARVGPEETFAWDPARSPFPGLLPFGVEDAAVFFGRDAEIDRLTELLAPSLTRTGGRCVCIVGPSGSGKSSLLHAGLLPRLARAPERWRVIPPFTPGRRPTRRLAAAVHSALAADGRAPTVEELEAELSTDGPASLRRWLEQLTGEADDVQHVLLVIDQLEELSTRTGRREQESFLKLLHDVLADDTPLQVVTTMRSEFISSDPGRAELSELIDDSLVVGPLSRSRLPEVIVRPARRAGLEFEPGLVERIVEDTTGGGALPLLAYTLHELAERAAHEGHPVVTAADYEAVGGVVGALQSRADQLVDELTRGRRYDRAIVERTLLRLAAVDEDGLPVRRRVPLSGLDTEERAIVGAFVDARLLVTHQPPDAGTGTVVDVAHEALLREWEPLRHAIDNASNSLRLRAELGREAADWDGGGRDPSYLLRGSRLAVFDDWAGRHPADFDALEQQFLQASRTASEQQLQAAHRTNRRLRRLSVGLAVVLVLALVAAGLAVLRQIEAREQANLALTRQLLAQAALLRPTQPDVSLLLNVEAVRRAEGPGAEQARYALIDGLNRAFHVSTRLVGHFGAVDAVEFAPAAELVATEGEDGVARLWDAVSGELQGELPTGAREAVGNPLAFDPRGRVLAVVNGSAVQLWDTTTRQRRGEPLAGHTGTVYRATFSPDGTLLATVSEDRTVRLWEVDDAAPHGEPLVGHDKGVFDVTFSPNGRTVAAGGWDGTVRSWDVADGRAGPVLTGHTDAVSAVAFGHDDATLYSAGLDGTVRSWDPHSGSVRHVFAGHSGPVATMALSDDGRVLASGGDDAMVRLWDAATGAPLGEPLTGHSGVIRDLAFGPGGRTLVSGSIDGTLRLWDVATRSPLGEPLAGHTSRILDIAISSDGATVASASADGTARLWQTSETRLLGQRLSDDASTSVAVGPAGLLVTACRDGRVRLWDLAADAPTAELTGHEGFVHAVAVSVNGVIASGGEDRTVRLWDAATRRPLGSPLRAADAVLDVALSPDGGLVAAAGKDGTVSVWSRNDGALRSSLVGHSGPVMSVAFGPGATLASGGYDRTVRVWSTETNQLALPPLSANGPVLDVAFSPDGSTLASGGAASAIQLWDSATGVPRGNVISGFTGWINDIAFTPDGRTIASAGDEGSQLWDVATGQNRGGRLQTRTAASGVAIGADGPVIAAAGGAGTTVWNLRPDVLLSQACRIANRNLSRAEWDRYLTTAAPYSRTCP